MPASSPVRQLLTAYGNAAGIEAGYSYFAPSVPANCKLLFEVHYADGRVEYDPPHVKSDAAGYRLATLLDYLIIYHSVSLREAILQPLAYECWKLHPSATSIRAIVTTTNLPTIEEHKRGVRRSYSLEYEYDFRIHPQTVGSASY